MHVGRHGAGRKVAIEIFRAQLQAHLRPAAKVHRPLASFDHEADGLQGGDRTGNLLDCNDKVDIPRDHRLGSPVVHGDAADRAPVQFGPLERINHAHHVVRAAGRLPIVELSPSHGADCTQRSMRLPNPAREGLAARGCRQSPPVRLPRCVRIFPMELWLRDEGFRPKVSQHWFRQGVPAPGTSTSTTWRLALGCRRISAGSCDADVLMKRCLRSGPPSITA